MRERVKKIVKIILGRRIYGVLRNLRQRRQRFCNARKYCRYDADRFMKYSGAFTPMDRESLLAVIIMKYHIIEKGLTMPNRRFVFGRSVLLELMKLIDEYERRYGRC